MSLHLLLQKNSMVKPFPVPDVKSRSGKSGSGLVPTNLVPSSLSLKLSRLSYSEFSL